MKFLLLKLYVFDFTDLIKPVRLPSRSQIDDTFAGKMANVSGWGLTNEGTTQ